MLVSACGRRRCRAPIVVRSRRESRRRRRPTHRAASTSRATSTQIVQPKPCVSHSSTLPFGVATRDEARLVGLVTLAAAAAVARHVLEDFGMLRREVVGRAHDVHRAHRREADVRQRRHRHSRHAVAWRLPARLGVRRGPARPHRRLRCGVSLRRRPPRPWLIQAETGQSE